MSKYNLLILAAMVASCVTASANAADVCKGPPPKEGLVVRGPVLDIPDASSICVALDQSPSTWIRIQLRKPAATRAMLMAAAFGKKATCTLTRDGYGECAVESLPLEDALRRPEIAKAAASWTRHDPDPPSGRSASQPSRVEGLVISSESIRRGAGLAK